MTIKTTMNLYKKKRPEEGTCVCSLLKNEDVYCSHFKDCTACNIPVMFAILESEEKIIGTIRGHPSKERKADILEAVKEEESE